MKNRLRGACLLSSPRGRSTGEDAPRETTSAMGLGQGLSCQVCPSVQEMSRSPPSQQQQQQLAQMLPAERQRKRSEGVVPPTLWRRWHICERGEWKQRLWASWVALLVVCCERTSLFWNGRSNLPGTQTRLWVAHNRDGLVRVHKKINRANNTSC